MASTPKVQATTMEDEIIDITRVLADVQDRLVKLARQREGDVGKLKQLEQDNARLKNGVKYLGNVNADLQRKVKAHKPELEKAVEARDAAFKKLRHARKVVKDLIEEKEMMEENEEQVISPALSALSLGSLKELLSPKSSTPSSGSSTSSKRTIRSKTIHLQNTLTPRSPLSPSLSRRPNASPASVPKLSTLEEDGGCETEFAESPSTSAHPGSPAQSARTEDDKWVIHYKRLPKSVKTCKGPYGWDDLQYIFNIKDALMATLRSLQSPGDLGMRIHILGDIAFVYDPTFLESGKNSYLLDWGRQTANTELINHIAKSGHSAYYTFVFPKVRHNWYFIGALTWKVVDNWPVWPTLRNKSREEIVKRLSERCGEPDKERISTLLSDGEAEQVCVEMMGNKENDQLTRRFARRLRKKGIRAR